MFIILRKIIWSVMITALLTLPFLGGACADGGVFGKNTYVFSIEETNQYAVIDYYKGIESLYISINFNWERSNKTAWIIPVPVNPDNMTVELPGGTPILTGSDMEGVAESRIEDLLFEFSMSYTFSIFLPYPININLVRFTFSSLSGSESGSESSSVDIEKRVEKYGLTAEVISATDGIGLYQYLTSQGLDINEGIIPQIDEYITKEYSFVVIWISNSNILTRYPGVLINFPIHKIFYPMILTSIYGETKIPINIMIIGHNTPKLYKEIEKDSKISYYTKGDIDFRYDYDMIAPNGILPNGFFDFIKRINSHWDGKFTALSIDTPAKNFKKDIWIENDVSSNVEYSLFINDLLNERNSFIFLMILSFLYSIVFSIILGWQFIKKDKKEVFYYFLIGLSNLVGIIGFIISIPIISKHRKYNGKAQGVFMVLFLISFIISVIFSIWALLIPLNL